MCALIHAYEHWILYLFYVDVEHVTHIDGDTLFPDVQQGASEKKMVEHTYLPT